MSFNNSLIKPIHPNPRCPMLSFHFMSLRSWQYWSGDGSSQGSNPYRIKSIMRSPRQCLLKHSDQVKDGLSQSGAERDRERERERERETYLMERKLIVDTLFSWQ